MLVAGSHKRTMNLEKFNKKLGEKLVVVPAYNSRDEPRARFPQESQKIVVPQTKETANTDLLFFSFPAMKLLIFITFKM